MSDSNSRWRWINLGELIALAALLVSAVGVWIAWKSSNEDKPTRVVEQRSSVPLALRGSVDSDGRTVTITPADSGHALEGLTVFIKKASPIEVGSDGRLSANDVEAALGEQHKETKGVVFSVPIRIDAHYVEMGKDRHGGGSYVLRCRWEGGSLFSGRSLHITGFSKG